MKIERFSIVVFNLFPPTTKFIDEQVSKFQLFNWKLIPDLDPLIVGHLAAI